MALTSHHCLTVSKSLLGQLAYFTFFSLQNQAVVWHTFLEKSSFIHIPDIPCVITLNNVGQVLFPVVNDIFVHSSVFSGQQTELYIMAFAKRLQPTIRCPEIVQTNVGHHLYSFGLQNWARNGNVSTTSIGKPFINSFIYDLAVVVDSHKFFLRKTCEFKNITYNLTFVFFPIDNRTNGDRVLCNASSHKHPTVQILQCFGLLCYCFFNVLSLPTHGSNLFSL